MSQLPDYLNKGGGKLRSPPAGYVIPEYVEVRIDLEGEELRKLKLFITSKLGIPIKDTEWDYNKRLDCTVFTLHPINGRDMQLIEAQIKTQEEVIAHAKQLEEYSTAYYMTMNFIREIHKKPKLEINKLHYPLPLLSNPSDNDRLMIIPCDSYEEMNRMKGYINRSKHRRHTSVYASMEAENMVIVVHSIFSNSVNRMRRLINAAHYRHMRFNRHNAETETPQTGGPNK